MLPSFLFLIAMRKDGTVAGILFDTGVADPLGSVEKIIKVGLAIEEAVKTVRKDKEECRDIRNRVLRVSALLKRLQETAMINDPAMREALEALEETLIRTHELILACQKKNIMCRFCTAGDMSKRRIENCYSTSFQYSQKLVDKPRLSNKNRNCYSNSFGFVRKPNDFRNRAGLVLSKTAKTEWFSAIF